jgi:hypothetical protein
VLNGLIQPFQQPERVVGSFNTYWDLYPVSKPVLHGIATQYKHWVSTRAIQDEIRYLVTTPGVVLAGTSVKQQAARRR